MKPVSEKSFLSLTIAAVLFAGAGAAQAATDCFWARDTGGKHVRDGAGQCVKSGLWHSGVATPAECGGKAAEAAKPAKAPEPVTINAVVLFESDKSTLTADGRAVLDSLANRLGTGKSYDKIILTGMADSTASEAYNQKLSAARGATVKSYLVGKGLDGSKITINAVGETAPVASNDTAAGRAQNRRVNVEVQGFRK